MSIAALSAGSSLLTSLAQGTQTNRQQMQQEFQELGSGLESGNLSGAQQDDSTIQQDLQSQSTQAELARAGHHQHRHVSGDSNDGSTTSDSQISQLMSELGSALQFGNLPNAQQAYSSLQQDLLQFTQSGAATSAVVSLTA
jgi:hypothetical protein